MDPQFHPLKRLTVFGFGLIGASVALAAKARWPDLQLTAIDRADVIGTRGAQAIANVLVNSDDASARQHAFAGADLSVLAAPLSALEQILPEALSQCRLVTDCGSTKRTVMAAVALHPQRGRFVAGHPIAGKPVGGLDQADPHLFEGRPWILCPAGSGAEAILEVEHFVRAVGAVPARMEAEDHDRDLALTSHLPQLLASALLVLAERGNVSRFARGPGFDSATRVAGGSVEMWRDILERNGDHIALSLEQLIAELSAAAQALRGGSPELKSVLTLLAQARKARENS